MENSLEAGVQAIDDATLKPLVERALGVELSELGDWNCQPVTGGAGGQGSLFRFAGSGQTCRKAISWAIILKTIGLAHPPKSPTERGYWRREPLVYSSGILGNLPGGIGAPHCLAVTQPSEQEYWIWLESLTDEIGRWPLERYGLAARHLGQFNGVYLAGESLPVQPWLSRGDLRARVTGHEAHMARLHQHRDHPIIRQLFPDKQAENLLRLWAQRSVLLSLIEQLPQTFCHLDAGRRNLFARTSPDGQAQTVLIDWAQAGIETIGDEIAHLLGSTLCFLEVDSAQAVELGEIVWEGYLDGLRDGGYSVRRSTVRFVYAVAAALRFVPIGVSFALADQKLQAWLEALVNAPFPEMMEHWSQIMRYLLDLSADALEGYGSITHLSP